jgi:hypothetical protein
MRPFPVLRVLLGTLVAVQTFCPARGEPVSTGNPAPVVADWPCIGADAGLSKYSSVNIPVDTVLRLQYKKRFHRGDL